MSLTNKGSRKITVNKKNYLWRVTKDTKVSHGEILSVLIQNKDENNCVLKVCFKNNESVTPSLIREIILSNVDLLNSNTINNACIYY